MGTKGSISRVKRPERESSAIST